MFLRIIIIEMGNCECPSNSSNKYPELKLVQSDYSMVEEYSLPQPPKLSKFISTSTIYSNMFKVTSQTDDRISSKVVQSTQKDLPLSSAAQLRDLMIPEE